LQRQASSRRREAFAHISARCGSLDLSAGAEIVDDESGAVVIENRRCPFAMAVCRDACVCHAAVAFFREATGLPFEQNCYRGEKLTCRYLANVAVAD
jgi:predicted ArsR family transcriptional regulator